jgi:hypothetical protein
MLNLPEGFTIKEDDHILLLFYKGKEIASFIATRVPAAEIEAEAQAHLRRLSRVIDIFRRIGARWN